MVQLCLVQMTSQGIVEIIEAVKYLKEHPEIKHGDIKWLLVQMKKLVEEQTILM